MKTFLMALVLLAWAGLAHTAELAPDQRQTLLEYTRSCLISRLEGTTPQPTTAPFLQRQRPCFVTFFKNRTVMACFGSFTPRRTTLAEEIAENIRLALKNDPRSVTLTPELARSMDIQLSFPEAPQPIPDWRTINPLKEGLFVETPDGRGVAIVPGEARTAQYAWRSALKRLGMNEQTAGVRLYRFRAEVVTTR
jgi:AMMECR1 domain-containing protein